MPKTVPFDFVVQGSPDEVRERLEKNTRWRLLPHQQSSIGKGGLGGRIRSRSFTVSIDQPSLLQRSVPVARGHLETSADGGTRVHGVAGMPGWVTWSLRLGVMVFPVFLILLGANIWTEGGALATYSVLVAAAAVALVGSVGWQVNEADEGINALVEELRRVTEAPTSPNQEQRIRQGRASRAQQVHEG